MGAHWQGGDLDRLAADLRARLPETVGLAITDPRRVRVDNGSGLWPEEELALARSVVRRRREFTAGRVAARQAMASIGLPEAPVPMGPDRAPVWPTSVVGSISHCDTICIAVAARVEDMPGLGIDVEENTALDRVLWDEICTRDELAWLAAQPKVRQGALAKRIFSAKEAVYKAVYPQEGRILEFQEVEISPALLRRISLVSGEWIASAWTTTGVPERIAARDLV